MRIFLLGFMGSGKSYTGKRLAKKLQYPFVDLDDWIELNEKKKISEIFRTEGESAFRLSEQKALHEMLQFEKAVIATGGGVPCFFDNLKWMNHNGLTIYLKTPVEILVNRLIDEKMHRPLIREVDDLSQFIKEKLQERESFYNKASIIYHQKDLNDSPHEILFNNLNKIIGH